MDIEIELLTDEDLMVATRHHYNEYMYYEEMEKACGGSASRINFFKYIDLSTLCEKRGLEPFKDQDETPNYWLIKKQESNAKKKR
jgi:hypothetical protein